LNELNITFERMRTFAMPTTIPVFLKQYVRILLCFIITVCLIRVYEYYNVASKSFTEHPLFFELAGLLYDIWACFIYSLLFLLPYFLLNLIHKKTAAFVFHFLNVLLLIIYISLIIVYSERNNPFDHEFFTRKASDSWITTKQMMTTGFYVYIPFIVFIFFYFMLYFKKFQKINITNKLLVFLTACSVFSATFIRFANPPEHWFKQTGAYYLTCNKFSFWVADSYNYFTTRNLYDASKLSNQELDAAIEFYQSNHPFEFTSKEYPLLHKNTGEDVLGSFFNLDKNNPPNIVILVGEGLSSDFSGEHAYAGSFTPFLDSLSKHSLVWDNFLSTAPATFAAHPAIEGSLPYGERGFSSMNIMPDHLSLTKILKANGYRTNFHDWL
jgi:glucan phosphoethanolaminetransferase (alkaline phosphatase superfamily)